MYSVYPLSLLAIASLIIGTATGQNDHPQPVQIHQYFNTESSGGGCLSSEEAPITIGQGPQGKPGKRGAQGLKGEKGNKGDPGMKGEAGLNGKNFDDAVITQLQGKIGRLQLSLDAALSRLDDLDKKENGNSSCVFPFTYKGMTYTMCTGVDAPKPWCSYDSLYGSGSGWGFCEQEIGKYEFLGCFKDNANRDMVDPVITQTNTLEFCGSRCGNKGYRFFGVQNGQDCWCGNSYNTNPDLHAKVPDSECNKPCTGNADQMCGQAGRNGIFTTGI